jgi:hypothetical protein
MPAHPAPMTTASYCARRKEEEVEREREREREREKK